MEEYYVQRHSITLLVQYQQLLTRWLHYFAELSRISVSNERVRFNGQRIEIVILRDEWYTI